MDKVRIILHVGLEPYKQKLYLLWKMDKNNAFLFSSHVYIDDWWAQLTKRYHLIRFFDVLFSQQKVYSLSF